MLITILNINIIVIVNDNIKFGVGTLSQEKEKKNYSGDQDKKKIFLLFICLFYFIFCYFLLTCLVGWDFLGRGFLFCFWAVLIFISIYLFICLFIHLTEMIDEPERKRGNAQRYERKFPSSNLYKLGTTARNSTWLKLWSTERRLNVSSNNTIAHSLYLPRTNIMPSRFSW